MKGLELAECFFNEYGLPVLKEKFSNYQHRIAAGLIGDGSECYGYDDELSRDHDWGPGFCFWLTGKDYAEIGPDLQHEYDQFPKNYRGFERRESDWGQGRVGVFETGEFYRKYIGSPEAPVLVTDWLHIPESSLSACTAGKVFYDPSGNFSMVQADLLRFYPEDVRLVKIAARCMSAAQSGQYNYSRCIGRKEYFAAQYAETKFCADIMSLVSLLNRKYAPYYKWLHHSIQYLPVLGSYLHARISELVNSKDSNEKQEIIEAICAVVISEFHTQRLSDSTSDFLLDHGPVIHGKIIDDDLRKRNVWLG